MRTPWLILGIIALVVVGGSVWAFQRSRVPAPFDAFAACLGERGAKMYGTSWCPYCKKQKELFGRSSRRIPYVECAMPGNPRSQAPVCRDAGVTGYPTWIFADGSRTTGVQEISALAGKTGCTPP